MIRIAVENGAVYGDNVHCVSQAGTSVRNIRQDILSNRGKEGHER